MLPEYLHPFSSDGPAPTPEQMKEVYQGMLRLFEEAGPETGLLIENKKEMEALLRQGKPLLSRLSETAEFPGFEEIFEALSQHLLHQSTAAPDAYTLISQIVSGRDEYWEEIGSWWGIEPAISAVLGTLAAKPYLMATARELKGKVDLRLWQRPRCPICHSFPSMETLVEPQDRALLCSLCETEWPYQTAGCVFCGSVDEGRPTPSLASDMGGFGLDLCDKCSRYLKTADPACGAAPLSSIADLDTFELDVAAQEMDYQRESLNPVGIRDIEP